MVTLTQLPVVKTLVLSFASRVGQIVPEAQPKRPVSCYLKLMFQLLKEAAGMSPGLHPEDGRWKKTLVSAERLLIYVSEEDAHYAGQLAQTMLLTHDIVEKSRKRFEPGARGDVAWMEWACGHGTTGARSLTGEEIEAEMKAWSR